MFLLKSFSGRFYHGFFFHKFHQLLRSMSVQSIKEHALKTSKLEILSVGETSKSASLKAEPFEKAVNVRA